MDKPAFDPSKPFTADKPAFDPNQAFTSGEEKPTPYIDGAKALARGTANMVKGLPGDINAGVQAMGDATAFGYTPQLAGAVGALGDAAVDAYHGQAPSLDSLSKSYLETRDFALRNQMKNTSEHPVSSGIGSLAGAVTAPVPGLGILKAETLAGKAGAAALKGAGYGFAMNPGDHQGEIAPGQLDQRVGNGLFGAGLGVAGEGLVNAVEKSPEAMQSMRRYFTAKELGANTSQMKQLLRDLPGGGGASRLDRMEQFLNEHKLLNTGKTFSDIQDATKGIRNDTGKAIGQTYNNVQQEIAGLAARNPEAAAKLDETALHGPDMAIEFLNKEKARLEKIHGGQAVHDSLAGELGTPENPVGLSALGRNASVPDLVNYRASVDDAVNWSKRSADRAPHEQSLVNLRNFLNDKINGRVGQLDQTLGTENTRALKSLNAKYADASLANKITEATKAREMSKFTPGILGAVGGGAYGTYGVMHGESPGEALAKGAALGLGMRAARIYGPGMAYSATRALEPMAGHAAEMFSKTKPGAGILTSPWVELTKDNK